MPFYLAFLYHLTFIPRAEAVNVLDCDIVANEFELKSRYYIHFRNNNIEKGMNHLPPLAMC